MSMSMWSRIVAFQLNALVPDSCLPHERYSSECLPYVSLMPLNNSIGWLPCKATKFFAQSSSNLLSAFACPLNPPRFLGSSVVDLGSWDTSFRSISLPQVHAIRGKGIEVLLQEKYTQITQTIIPCQRHSSLDVQLSSSIGGTHTYINMLQYQRCLPSQPEDTYSQINCLIIATLVWRKTVPELFIR